jgi:hypothetical protein
MSSPERGVEVSDVQVLPWGSFIIFGKWLFAVCAGARL